MQANVVKQQLKLNKRIVKQTLRGYKRANRFIEEERRAQLQKLTHEQSWAIFDDLYRTWERMGKRGHEGQVTRREDVRDCVALRRKLNRFAHRMRPR